MNLLNAAAEKKKRLKVELTIAQKWEIIEYSKKFVDQALVDYNFNKRILKNGVQSNNIQLLEKSRYY